VRAVPYAYYFLCRDALHLWRRLGNMLARAGARRMVFPMPPNP